MAANVTEWRDVALRQENASSPELLPLSRSPPPSSRASLEGAAVERQPLQPPLEPFLDANAKPRPTTHPSATLLDGVHRRRHRDDAPLKVYGREKETRQLIEAVERCADRSSARRRELLLVTGPSGAGKTVLVQAALRPSDENDSDCAKNNSNNNSESSGRCPNWFASGKFDLLERSEQYYPVVQALTELALCVARDGDQLNSIRSALAPFKETHALLLDLVPGLGILFGDSGYGGDKSGAGDRTDADADNASSDTSVCSIPLSPCEALEQASSSSGPSPPDVRLPSAAAAPMSSHHSPSSTRARLKLSIRTFLEAACRATGRGLVLFLDDLQWAEPASLDLVGYLLQHSIPGLVVVGACRDNELSSLAHLSVLLRELEAGSVAITQIPVGSVGHDSLLRMLEDGYAVDAMQASVLGGIVMKETGGNMLYAVQFLRALIDEGLLFRMKDGSLRFESEAKVRSLLGGGRNVTRLVGCSIQKQDRAVQDTLMVASCLGAEFSEVLLEEAVSYDVENALEVAEAKDFLVRLGPTAGKSGPSWRFAHDQIQQSAYSLIPSHEREQVHLRIGRTLWGGLADADLIVHANVVVKQLRLGARLIVDEEEREQMAHLLLRSGEQAARSASHGTAQEHFGLGISLLGKRHWRDQYDLSLALYNAAAEVEYCLGNLARMDELTTLILKNTRSREDKIRVQTNHMYSLGSRNELQAAIKIGLTSLKECFGISFPKWVSPFKILFELMKTKRMLRRYSNEDILSLPPMNNSTMLASMRIMVLLFSYALSARPMLSPLVSLKLVQCTLLHGSSSMSSAVFANFAMMMTLAFRDPHAGLRFGKLAVQIQERCDCKEWIPRVNTAVYGYCFSCRGPLRQSLPPLLEAHRVGLGCGDIEFAMLSAVYYVSISVFAGMRLPQLGEDVRSFLELMGYYQQRWIEQLTRPCAQFILCLQGLCPDASVLDGGALNLDLSIQEAADAKNLFVIPIILQFKLMLSCFFGKYDEVEQVGREISSHMTLSAFPCYSRAPLLLHLGISFVANAYSGRRHRRLCLAKRNVKRLTKLMDTFSEINYGNKLLLLQAEILVAEGEFETAQPKYEASIAQGRRERIWSEVGLACELYSRALLRRGETALARTYLDQAVSAYERWGATAKVAQIRPTQNESVEP